MHDGSLSQSLHLSSVASITKMTTKSSRKKSEQKKNANGKLPNSKKQCWKKS